jgi:cation:H+ antiporter
MPFEMNIAWACLLLIGGLILLWKAADLLVDGAVALARRLGVSSLVIGLTVIAMGTSAPEVSASIAAALRGAGDMAVGNVYGSNIANLALVGGICALIAPIAIQKRLLKREMPVMLLVALLLWPFLHNLHLSRLEGVFLLALFVSLILLTVHIARREGVAEQESSKTDQGSLKKSLFFVIIGLAGLAFGADITVHGAVYIGQRVGLSKAVIGLTIIAIGTSLPELVTCVVAALKGHNDISIGNLVGSNVFNTLLVTGTAGAVRPFSLESPRLAGLDYWIMVAVSAIFVVMGLLFRRRINRPCGVVLLLGYICYMVYLLYYTAGV